MLNPIEPAPDYDGIIHLDWSDTVSTSRYYIYRETFIILDVNSLIPIAIVSQSTYMDTVGANGTYYYVVMSGNPSYNSTISGYQTVTVWLSTKPGPTTDYTGIIIIIVIGACAVATTLVVVKVRSKPKRTQMASQQFSVVKDKLKGVKSEWKDNLSIEDKIRALQRNVISIEELAELSDADLSGYFNQAFIPIPIKLIEFLQRLDAPLEDKVEIIAEFNNLSEEQKQEYLKELNEL
jgi:NADH:ubiquinone oxidoreductase subunit 3 (subunit A)